MTNQPYGVFESVKYALGLTWNNLGQVKRIVKPIIVPLAVLNAISSYIDQEENLAGFPYNLIEFTADILFFILSAFFAIAWHRLVILGPSKDNTVNLFEIEKGEIQFIFATFCFIVCMVLISVVAVLIAALFANGPIALVGWILAGAFGIFCYMLLIRASFYLPGKAVGADVTLTEAMFLGKGLAWRLVLATFLSTLVFLIPALIALVLCVIVFVAILNLFPSALMTFVMMFAISVPMLFVGFVGAAIFVTILSRYFLWAVQNKQA